MKHEKIKLKTQTIKYFKKTIPIIITTAMLLSSLTAAAQAEPENTNTEITPANEILRPDSTSSVLRVNLRDVRMNNTGNGPNNMNSKYTEGARFELLYRDDTGSLQAVPEDWASCTTNSLGECWMRVPNTNSGGRNHNVSFWVGQTDSEPGSLANNNLYHLDSYRTRVEERSIPIGSSLVWRDTEYVFQTPGLRANNSYNVPTLENDRDSRRANNGFVANSVKNPILEKSCAVDKNLKVAVLFDLSGSISQTQMLQMRKAGFAIVEGLSGGHDAQLALYNFGTTAPIAGMRNHSLRNVDNQREEIEQSITEYTNRTTQESTNWDRGLAQIAESKDDYDLVLFLTDGVPTFFGSGRPTTNVPGNRTRFLEIDQAVVSANQLKDQNTRIIGVGIGNEFGQNPNPMHNALSAVTGTNFYEPNNTLISLENADYLIAEWDNLEELMTKKVSTLVCDASFTVTKLEEVNEQTRPAVAQEISANIVDTNATIPSETTQQTNSEGSASWKVVFNESHTTTNIQVDTRLQENFKHKATVCTTANGDHVELSEDAENFSLAANTGEQIFCTITSKFVFDPS